MTDKELIAQAIVALEYHTEQTRPIANTNLAIEALRARLAQPEPDDGYCQACDGDSCTAKEGCVARDNPPQRKWQGLTAEEIAILWKATPQLVGVYSYTDIAREVEAKLKEKNNG